MNACVTAYGVVESGHDSS